MKNLLILLSFIPQLLLAEQLNYFCEEIEDKALSFKEATISFAVSTSPRRYNAKAIIPCSNLLLLSQWSLAWFR